MKNKLELKHLAPYLPYKLKCKVGNNVRNIIFTEYYTNNHEIFFFNLVGNNFTKIMLRPLSNLTEEIEHEGEKFIPMQKMIEFLKYGDEYKSTLYWEKVEHYKRENKESYSLCIKSPICTELAFTIRNKILVESASIWVYNKLLEWHFDIFNLTGKDLAIKKE